MGNLCSQQHEPTDKNLEADLTKENVNTNASGKQLVKSHPEDYQEQLSDRIVIEDNPIIKYTRTFTTKNECEDYEFRREKTKRIYITKGKKITIEEFESLLPEKIKSHSYRNVVIKYPATIKLSDETSNFDFPPMQLNEYAYYYGKWNDECLKHGEGYLLNTKNELLYQGYFENDELVYGRIVRADGSFYEGEIKDFLPNGNGSKTIADTEDVYKGFWENGKLIKKVTILYKDGTIFEGQMNENKEFEGLGKIMWADGSSYNGYFVSNFIEGEGFYISGDGSFQYQGQFKASKFHGIGNSIWTHDGKVRRFRGEYEDGMKKHGVFIFTRGEEFTCQYENNLPNGEGTLLLTDGQCFKGDFRHGKYVQTDSTSKRYMPRHDELLSKIDKEPSEYAPHVKYNFDTYKKLVSNLKDTKFSQLLGVAIE